MLTWSILCTIAYVRVVCVAIKLPGTMLVDIFVVWFWRIVVEDIYPAIIKEKARRSAKCISVWDGRQTNMVMHQNITRQVCVGNKA
jgi:hypothetical protein